MSLALARRRLLRPRGALVFGGVGPGVDGYGIAGANLLFSGIASGGSFINLLTGQPGTVNGGANAPSSAIHSIIGPCAYFLNNGNVSFPYPATAWAAQTVGAVVVFDAATSGSVRQIITTAAGGVTGIAAAVNTTSVNSWSYEIGGTLTSPNTGYQALAIVAGVPYFYAASIQNGLPGNTILCRLDTGQMGGTSSANALSFAAGDTTLYIGNRGLNSRQTIGKIAAAMHANSYLSPTQLSQWGAAVVSWYSK